MKHDYKNNDSFQKCLINQRELIFKKPFPFTELVVVDR